MTDEGKQHGVLAIVHPCTAQIDRRGRSGARAQLDGVEAPAHTVASLEHDDIDVRGTQPSSRRQACDPRSDDDHAFDVTADRSRNARVTSIGRE